MSVKLMTADICGKKIAFYSDTEFLVQVGKGSKGSYKTRWTFKGNDIKRAWMYYDGINIGNGYKKRFVMPSAKKPVIHKVSS